MEKVKVISNVNGTLGITPGVNMFLTLPTKGASLPLTKDEIRYIFTVQQVIQKGSLLIDDKDLRVEFGLETEDGKKENMNILSDEEIESLVKSHHKTLEKTLSQISEDNILRRFVEKARELGLDSKAKIDLIEKYAKLPIYEDDES